MTIFQAGDFILNGEFRLEALVGAGAFAEVYRATHIALKAPRAIKVLRHDAPGVGSTEFAEYAQRFQLEAQLGAQLDSPHVVRVYDFRRDGEMLLLIMEYASGGSLTDRIERARKSSLIPIDEVIKLALEITEGLSAIHALDVVHRDLKPSNILFDAHNRAKVGDLGLAQVPGGPSMRSRLSQTVPHPGTPAYMSPEQANTSTHLSPSSDVYALGCIVFEMLTGRIYKNVRPGTRVKALRVDMPEWLDDLVVKMLADDPRGRPWEGMEVAKGVQQAMLEAQRQQGQQAAAVETRHQPEEQERKAVDFASEVQVLATHNQPAGEVASDELRDANQDSTIMESNHEPTPVASTPAATAEAQPLDATSADALVLLNGTLPDALLDQIHQYRLLRKLAQHVRLSSPDELILTLAPGVEMVLVRVPAGEFVMGTEITIGQKLLSKANKYAIKECEQPSFRINVPEYFIGKYTVTIAQFLVFAERCAYQFSHDRPVSRNEVELPEDVKELLSAWEPHERYLDASGYWGSFRGINSKRLIELGRHPATRISHQTAYYFCNWLSRQIGFSTKFSLRDHGLLTLPTEVQWEKAARSIDGRMWPWGNEEPNATRCNFKIARDYSIQSTSQMPFDMRGGRLHTKPVGFYSPHGDSPYGCADMGGNIWEWTWDSLTAYPFKDHFSGRPLGSNLYVARGGSYSDTMDKTRCAYRLALPPYLGGPSIGFRVALSTSPSSRLPFLFELASKVLYDPRNSGFDEQVLRYSQNAIALNDME